MKISCGIIPFRIKDDGEFEFFIAHPTGFNHWGLCKGGVEEGETYTQTAMREFREETGQPLGDVKETDLIPLGGVAQSKRKTVYAWGLYYPNIDPSVCFANMCEDGVTPENDLYGWFSLEDVKRMVIECHIPFYEKIIDIVTSTYGDED